MPRKLRPVGRPPVTGTTRTRSILMRVTDAEIETLQRAADRADEPLTTWVRRAALRAATTPANRKETR